MSERKKSSPIWLISRNKLSKIVKNSMTVGEVLAYFGLKNHGGNPRTLKSRLNHDKINYGHFVINRRNPYRRTSIDLSLILVENSTYSRSHLKKRLIKEKLIINQCAECNQKDSWNGKPLTLVLDHINGINNDNRIENLRLLCPNCNSQTLTFAGRNVRKPQKTYACLECGEPVKSVCVCKKCNSEQRKKIKIDKETLNKLVWEMPTTHIAKKYNVSDVLIGKLCKKYGIEKPTRGYWHKLKHSKIV